MGEDHGAGTAVRWAQQRLPAVLLVLLLVATSITGGGASADETAPQLPPETEETAPAAPAVAARLLAEAGIPARWDGGGTGGNHVADVARAMAATPGSDLRGVPATDRTAYECAVATVLRTKSVPAPVSPAACATVPNAPTSLTVSGGAGQLVVTWQPPTDRSEACTTACGAPVTSYTVRLVPPHADPVTVGADENLSVVVDGVTNGVDYTVAVVATNRIGDSQPATGTGTPQAGEPTFTAVSAGVTHTCGIADGAAWCWGSGANGRLGNGATSDEPRPVAVVGGQLPAGMVIVDISAGEGHTCAVGADGSAYCWGTGGSGRLGNGGTVDATVPVRVRSPGIPFATIAAGSRATCATTVAFVDFSGVARGPYAYCWGSNAGGVLGSGGGDTPTPRRVALPGAGEPTLPGGTVVNRPVTAVSVGFEHACAVVDGAAWCWGDNAFGKLGTGGTASSGPIAVATGDGSALPAEATVTAVSAGFNHSCAVADGAAYCWGAGGSGRLGTGTTSDRLLPAAVATGGSSQLPAGAPVTAISAGRFHTCALAPGSVTPDERQRLLLGGAEVPPWPRAYCWGDGALLGNGSTGGSSLPVAVTFDGPVLTEIELSTPATAISAGGSHACLLAGPASAADRVALCWGSNVEGQLGAGASVVGTLFPRFVLPPG